MMDEAGVDRAVIVPPSWAGDRIDYAATEAVKRHPGRFGIMGRVPIEKPREAAAQLPAWKQQPGMLGIRVSFNVRTRQVAHGRDRRLGSGRRRRRPASRSCSSPANQLPAFARIAERHPGLALVVDHMGLSLGYREGKQAGRSRGSPRLWRWPDIRTCR